MPESRVCRNSLVCCFFFFFSSRRRHTRCSRDWSSDVCSSDLGDAIVTAPSDPTTRSRWRRRCTRRSRRSPRRQSRMRSAQSAPICGARYGVLGGGSQEGAGSREQGAVSGGAIEGCGSRKWGARRRTAGCQIRVMKKYGSLVAWQRAHQLAIVTFKAADAAYHPRSRALLDQLRRAAISIEANIVEGYALSTPLQFRRHLRIALGSAAETECLIETASELGVPTRSDDQPHEKAAR